MKKEYRISRVILVVLTLITVQILFQNDGDEAKLVAGFLFGSAALLASFLGTRVSRKMIQIGDRIPNILLRILYYAGLLVGSLAIAALVGGGFIIVLGDRIHSNELGIAAGQAMLVLLFGFALFIFLIVPYLQTIIVLILRKIFKK